MKKLKGLAVLAVMMIMMTMLTACGSKADDTVVRIGGLKGPTSIGLLALKDDVQTGANKGKYEFTMATAADEILASVAKGELDIALVPANVACILYNKTDGNITVIDINTLGVLYMVSGDKSIASPADLEGKTVYLTGKGTTPDYVLSYILSENGVSNVNLQYKSEATEVAALLADDPDAIGLLPQPFVTVACAQNDALNVVMDMNEQWELIQGESGSKLVTGVTIVRDRFLDEHEGLVRKFLADHEASTKAVNEATERVAALAVSEGIIPKEPIALKAIPKCNIVCVRGSEMKDALSGYLKVLRDMDTSSIGGNLPGNDFYYGK